MSPTAPSTTSAHTSAEGELTTVACQRHQLDIDSTACAPHSKPAIPRSVWIVTGLPWWLSVPVLLPLMGGALVGAVRMPGWWRKIAIVAGSALIAYIVLRVVWLIWHLWIVASSHPD